MTRRLPHANTTRAAVVLAAAGLLCAQSPQLAKEGSRVVRAISSETHPYIFEAAEGQTLRIRLLQKGVDVELRLTAPDGSIVSMCDLPNGAFGYETIAVRAPQSGRYTATVKAGTSASGSNYEISLAALHDPVPGDDALLEAHSLLVRAESNRRLATAAAREAAIVDDEAAAARFLSLGETDIAADLINSAGIIRGRLSRPAEALKDFERARELYRQTNNSPRLATVANNVAGMYDLLNDPARSLAGYTDALSMYERAGDANGATTATANIAGLLLQQGRWRESLEAYRKVYAFREATGNRKQMGLVLSYLGTLSLDLGDSAAALEYYSRSLEIARSFGDSGVGVALRGIGTAHAKGGRYTEALRWYAEAADFCRGAGNLRDLEFSLRLAADAHEALGDLPRAASSLTEGLAIARRVGDAAGEAALQRSFARVHARSGDFPHARESAANALAIFTTSGEQAQQASALQVSGLVEWKAGDLPAALSFTDRALALQETLRTGADSESNRATYLGTVQTTFQQKISILMSLGRPAEALETAERARARGMLEMLAESGAPIREGVDPALLAKEKDLAGQLNLKAARKLTRPGDRVLDSELRALETEYQEVRAAIRSTSPRYAALAQPEPLRSGAMRALVNSGEALLQYSLGTDASYLWAVSSQGITAWKLPAAAVINEAADRVISLLTARAAVIRGETAAQRTGRLSVADRDLTTATAQLSRLILAPTGRALESQSLAIVADGGLQRIPFALLSDPANPRVSLIEGHEIVMLASFSSLALQRQDTARPATSRTLAIFADPAFSSAATASGAEATRILEHLNADIPMSPGTVAAPRIPRLPYTAQEARRISAVVSGIPGAQVRTALGTEASRQLALSGELSHYRYLHFATHGYLDTARPMTSALVLAQVDEFGKPTDGFLRVADIYNQRLGAELVVLSACQTALGQEISGEGVMGLTRAFQYAGVRRVIVSLWNVNDRATADLMEAFYRRMIKDHITPAAALRKAQLELRARKGWASPYYWAAFVQQGEWR